MSLRDLSDRELRERAGAKWTAAGPDVLPAWVAEMDFALAEPITAALHDAVDRGAVGYSPSDARTGVAEALATFATDRWSWALDPAHVVLVPDVMSGIELVLRTLCEDAPVVVPTPAYPPFLDVVPLTGRTLVPLPLSPDGPAVLDLDRLDAALAAGARTVLLCQPHNPWGRVFTRGELEGLRDVVVRHGARVISDEVHAPLVLKGATHVPYATLDGTAAHTSTVLSAAKAWNLPGLGVPRSSRAPRRTPASSAPCPWSPSTAPRRWVWSAPSRPTARARRGWRSCGDVSTATAPCSPSSSPSCCRRCARRRLEATYLAWLDVRGLGLEDPAGLALRDGRVLVSDGARFGPGGAGTSASTWRPRPTASTASSGGWPRPGRPRRTDEVRRDTSSGRARRAVGRREDVGYPGAGAAAG